MESYKQKIKEALNDLKSVKTFYKQIPNLLTLSRVLAPIVILPLTLTGNLIPSIIVSGCLAATDLFDGLLARKFNACSELGKELDALSDKIFASSLAIPLIVYNPTFIINIVFETMIGLTNLIAKLKDRNPKTVFVGKVKTFFLFGTIIAGYINLFNPINLGILLSLIGSTIAIQGITLVSYVNKNFINYNNVDSIKITELNEIKDNEQINSLKKNNDLKYEKEINYSYNTTKKEQKKTLVLKLPNKNKN